MRWFVLISLRLASVHQHANATYTVLRHLAVIWPLHQACSGSVCAVQGAWDMMQQGDAGPALWSAEEPNLYILVLSLIAPDGSHVESESCQVRSPKEIRMQLTTIVIS